MKRCVDDVFTFQAAESVLIVNSASISINLKYLESCFK